MPASAGSKPRPLAGLFCVPRVQPRRLTGAFAFREVQTRRLEGVQTGAGAAGRTNRGRGRHLRRRCGVVFVSRISSLLSFAWRRAFGVDLGNPVPGFVLAVILPAARLASLGVSVTACSSAGPPCRASPTTAGSA
jgi:hypothetical protein